MPRYEFKRDHRGSGGPRLSLVVTARSYEEAAADFEARWEQKVGSTSPQPSPHAAHAERGMTVRTTKQIQATAMTPQALAVKRNTRGSLK